MQAWQLNEFGWSQAEIAVALDVSKVSVRQGEKITFTNWYW